MGLFDDVAKQEQEKISIEITENVVKDLFKAYLDTYNTLVSSPAYSEVFNREKDKAFNDFQEYFISKGFNIYPAEFSNGKGYRAVLGDFKVEFSYVGEGEFHCNIRGIEHERLVLEDKKAEKRLFQGYIHNDEITILGNNADEDRLGVYGKAAEDIKQDIALLNKNIEEQYKPEFLFYLDQRQKYVNSVKDYLELVNEQSSKK